MPQLVTRIDETLLGEVDRLVAEGSVASRSDAVRLALSQLIERRRRRATGELTAPGRRPSRRWAGPTPQPPR
jgi:metal-responsive CopG/Arc/MetJ family transcriptional regulator